MQYSETVREHFFNPRNCFRMEKPDVVGKAGEPGSGPFMLFFLRVEGERIREASYQTYGCGPAIAAGSVVTERLQGASRVEVASLKEPVINEALGGLPAAKRHCSALAAQALEDALRRWSPSATEASEQVSRQ
ncbi:MAG TPA: iron-sulfur cluster assembly scaffold protein [Planctomycetota bacterium]|nr:iron-sulfur cluster assembly scaffold protein [Planctomycetota bacterium]